MGINYKVSIKVFGAILCILSMAMCLPLMVGILYGEKGSVIAFIKTILPTLSIGLLTMKLFGSSGKVLKMRDGAFIVSVSWLICSLVGCVPMYLSGSIPNFVDAFFEMCSGFSTTGATILHDIEALPKAMLFWRTFSQWLGGMGILVFTIALLPAIGVEGQQLAEAEMPGPTLSKLTPKLSDTARSLYVIYIVLTGICAIMLYAGNMNLFDAVCHSFSTLGSGGFANYDDSIGYFNSDYIEMVVIVFMFLAGVNFNLFFIYLKSGTEVFRKDGEFKLYCLIIGIITVMTAVMLIIKDVFGVVEAFQNSLFTTVSIITTTGFVTTDYIMWPMFCQILLLLLFFCGGCSSSTAGGVKVYRILVLAKLVRSSIAIRLHPNAVVRIKVNNQQVPKNTFFNIANFLFLFVGAGMVVAFFISFDEFDFITNLSASFSCLGNVGPAFGALGSSGNFSFYSDISKVLLAITMIAGRLEVFTLLMIFTRRFWNPFH